MKIVLLFGSPVSVQTEPGLSLRVPFLSDVRTFDKRYLYSDSEPLPMQTRDAEQPVIDHYVVWRIRDPLQFFRSFPAGMVQAEAQVDRVTRSDVREEIGKRTFAEVVTTARGEVMKAITSAGARSSRPSASRCATSASTAPSCRRAPRRTSTRACAPSASGSRASTAPRATSKAAACAPKPTRGAGAGGRGAARGVRAARQGEADAARIYARRTRSSRVLRLRAPLEAYRKTIGEKTTLVLPPDNEFFELLGTAARARRRPSDVGPERRALRTPGERRARDAAGRSDDVLEWQDGPIAPWCAARAAKARGSSSCSTGTTAALCASTRSRASRPAVALWRRNAARGSCDLARASASSRRSSRAPDRPSA